MPSLRTFLHTPSRRSQVDNKKHEPQIAQAPLSSKKHNPANFQHLDLRGKFDKDAQDVLIGRVQWSLENQLEDPKFKGNRKNLKHRIDKLQAARDHLHSIPKDKVSSGDIAVVEKALRKAADALPDSSQKKAISMMATYMSSQWGEARREQVAKNVSKEQHYLLDDGAKNTQSQSVSVGAQTSFGDASVGSGSTEESSINHEGAYLNEKSKRRFGRIKLGANLGAAKANVSAEAAHSKTKKSSEAYSGGTEDYVKQKGYKKYFGSKRADAKAAELKRAANVNASPHLPSPSTQAENAAVAAARPEAKAARMARPLTALGVKNDLAAHDKVQQQAANQASLFKALLTSEFGLDVELPTSEAQSSRTKVEGRSYEASVKASATAGATSGVASIAGDAGGLGISAGVSAKAKFLKKENAYVKYEPMWEVLKNKGGEAKQQTPVMEQRTEAVLKQAQSYVKHHPDLFQGSNVTLESASDKELMEALKKLEADVDNYVSYQKIMSRQGGGKTFASAMKKQTHEIEKHYGASSSRLRGTKASEEFIKATTLIHAAIGAQLMKKGALQPEALEKMDGVAKKLRSPDIPINHDKILESTHFSSKSKVSSSTQSAKFKLSYGVELPSISSDMPGLSKSQGISVEVARTKQTEHPDRLSRGESIDITISMPGAPTPKALESIALSVAQKAGIPNAADAILENLTNAVNLDTDTEDGKLSLAMKFTKPALDEGKDKKFKLEYATARVAVKNKSQSASLSPQVAGLPVSPQLGLKRQKEIIVPIATYYGEGSFKNIISSYNATHTNEAASDANWEQQKSRRQPALDRLLVSMGNPKSDDRQMMEQLFDEMSSNVSVEQAAEVNKKRDTFFALADQASKAPKGSEELKDLTAKMNDEFEGFLAMHHESWLKSIDKEMKEQV